MARLPDLTKGHTLMGSSLVVVAGAGGFIGGHLVARLRAEGRAVRVRADALLD